MFVSIFVFVFYMKWRSYYFFTSYHHRSNYDIRGRDRNSGSYTYNIGLRHFSVTNEMSKNDIIVKPDISDRIARCEIDISATLRPLECKCSYASY